MAEEIEFDDLREGGLHKANWWQRITKGVRTTTNEKKEAPDGFWHKCPNCKHTAPQADFIENDSICTKCNYHGRISSTNYFNLFFDEGKYTIHFDEIQATDKLNFVDIKPYAKRLVEAQKSSNLTDSIQVADGLCNTIPLVIAAMDFSFIGGSMGSVMGERIAKAIDLCIAEKKAFMIISKSGGARMMESTYSLMQMAKTSAKLTQLAEAKLPYISLMTDPTTGGVSASFAMLGDINIAEPGALIGFAGPRVVKETIKKELPEGFQSAESLLENGFLDFIVSRKELKERITEVLKIFMHK